MPRPKASRKMVYCRPVYIFLTPCNLSYLRVSNILLRDPFFLSSPLAVWACIFPYSMGVYIKELTKPAVHPLRYSLAS